MLPKLKCAEIEYKNVRRLFTGAGKFEWGNRYHVNTFGERVNFWFSININHFFPLAGHLKIYPKIWNKRHQAAEVENV